MLRAAARVFKAKGLAAASLGDIAAEAGVDRASLYYYVGSKEEVVRGAVEVDLAWAQEFRASDIPAPQELRQMVLSLVRSYAADYPILYVFVFVQEDLSRVPDKYAQWSSEMRRSNEEFEDIVIEVVAEGMERGTIRAVGSPVLVAYGLLGMLVGPPAGPTRRPRRRTPTRSRPSSPTPSCSGCSSTADAAPGRRRAGGTAAASGPATTGSRSCPARGPSS